MQFLESTDNPILAIAFDASALELGQAVRYECFFTAEDSSFERRYIHSFRVQACNTDDVARHNLQFSSAEGHLLAGNYGNVRGCSKLRAVVVGKPSGSSELTLGNFKVTRASCPPNHWQSTTGGETQCIKCEPCAWTCQVSAEGVYSGSGLQRVGCVGASPGSCVQCPTSQYIDSDGEVCQICDEIGHTCIDGCKRAVEGGKWAWSVAGGRVFGGVGCQGRVPARRADRRNASRGRPRQG